MADSCFILHIRGQCIRASTSLRHNEQRISIPHLHDRFRTIQQKGGICRSFPAGSQPANHEHGSRLHVCRSY